MELTNVESLMTPQRARDSETPIYAEIRDSADIFRDTSFSIDHSIPLVYLETMIKCDFPVQIRKPGQI